MRIRRVASPRSAGVVLAAVIGLALAAWPGAAGAQHAPATQGANAASKARLGVSPARQHPKGQATVSGQAFPAGAAVTVTFDKATVAKAKANSKGAFTATVTVPASAKPGTHELDATTTKEKAVSAKVSMTVSTNWRMAGFDAQGQYSNPYENVLGRSNAATLTPAWTDLTSSYSTDTTGRWTSPILVNGYLYTSYYFNDQEDVGALTKIDAATGAVVWQAQSAYGASGVVVYNGDDFWFGSGIYITDDATGAYVGKINNVAGVTAAQVVGNMVYTQGTGGYPAEVNLDTDQVVWEYTPATGTDLASGWTYDNGAIYMALYVEATSSYNIVALNATNGDVLWNEPSPAPIGSDSPDPVAENSAVVFATSRGTTFALDEQSGSELWSTSTGTTEPYELAAANESIYEIFDYSVVALGDTDGTIQWTTPLQTGGAAVWANGVLYVTTGGITALDDQTGDVISTISSPDNFQGLALVNGNLYASSIHQAFVDYSSGNS
jgi:outer membrane protein assembly factor BamB